MRVLLLLLLFFCSKIVNSQYVNILETFEVFEVNGKVQISATVKRGYSCLGINFLRSEDSTVQFQAIGSIPGVCGSNYEPIIYDFYDEDPPKNKNLYYRVELGGIGLSEIAIIKIIDTGTAAYLLSPNPARLQSTVYFKNEEKTQHRLTLLNRTGLTIFTIVTNDNYFNLTLDDIEAGIYHFVVTTEDSKRHKFTGEISVY